jgi:uncharacterized protein YdeI (YjbR/CyaY-like superfamily)
VKAATPPGPKKPRFFRTQAEFALWLERHHDTANELWVGYYKKSTGQPSITWPESVDEALRFGWIDGVRKGIDDDRYMNRFTPRRPGSTWSAKNIKRAQELIALGIMRPAGRKAFQARTEDRSGIYSYEQRHLATLDPEYERQFRRKRKAWRFFESCPPSYRKAATHWVMAAKREETQRRRLARLIEDSAKGRTVPPLTPQRRQG